MTEKGTKGPRRTSRKKTEGEAASEAPRAKRAAPRTGASKAAAPEAAGQAPGERVGWVAVAAYYRAERRGFAPGYEVEDWLAAEAELDAAPPVAPSASPGARKVSPAKHPTAS